MSNSKSTIRTFSNIGCIRLCNTYGDLIFFRNYVGDGINKIYFMKETDDTDELMFLAEINGEWCLSEFDTYNSSILELNGKYSIYTDKHRNFFIKELS